MTVTLRPGTAADAPACGRIAYEAFKSVCERHGCPPDFPSAEDATGLLSMLLDHPRFYSVVAEVEGRVVGGQLMRDVIDRAARQGAAGTRLLQAGFHNRSLCLYSKLGFQTREPMSILQGAPLAQKFPGYAVRPATVADIGACNLVCRTVHGFDRDAELR